MTNFFRFLGGALGPMLASSFLSAALLAQTGAPSLSGQVKDQSGAAVGAVTVTVIASGGTALVAQTNEEGKYVFRNLPAGTYTVQIRLKGFADFTKTGVLIAAGQPQVVDAQLVVTLEKQEVSVKEESSHVGVNPDNNVGALVLKGDDLNMLSDNPDDMQNDLQALAGPAAGPNGGQIYIDGFTGGTLPPKSSIREIRINQSPFAAEFDRLGFGRIEIFTKPGTDKFHGRASFGFGDARFNSRNPFAPNRPPYQSKRFESNLSGPISRKASFFIGLEQQNVDETSVVSALILDPSLNVTPFSQAVLNPRKHTEFNPRIDYQLSTNNTLVARYSFEKRDQVNNGVGQFSLLSQGYNSAGMENGIQLAETAVLGPRAVNETRFRYMHTTDDITGATTAPTISVLSAFTGGGSSQGQATNIQNRYELQNNTSLSLSKHQVRFGVRLRDDGLSDRTRQGYNGDFTFTSLNAYRLTLLGQQNGLTPAQIRASGGGASQFSLTAGNPLASINQYDLGLFAQDDWRVRPNFTLSYGLRYETQNQISDHHDLAPRVSFAWALGRNKGRQPVTVLRAGAGIFYDRFGEDLTLQAIRLNGVTQQQFKVPNPDFFPNVPSLATLQGNGVPQTIRQVAPTLRAPYVAQEAIGIERQLPKNITLAVTYTNSHGVHSLRSRNINAPLPGTFDPRNPAAAVRPFGGVGNIYMYESSGIYNQSQLITNINARVSPKFSLFGFYTLSSAKSNSDGAGGFPANQYDLSAEYGPAGFDVRHRFFMGGNIAMRYGFSLSPFIVANSGQPFNIVVGRDLNGDSLFNDRPAFATDLTRPSVAQTIYGNFDTQPTLGERIIPRNFGRGPGQFSINLRLSKSFTFGPETRSPGSLGGEGGHGPGGHRGEGGPGGGLGPGGLSGRRPGGMFGGGGGSKRYSMEFNIQARNILNSVSLAPPIGNLSSPLFGHSNAIAGGFFGSSTANRRVELGVRFSF